MGRCPKCDTEIMPDDLIVHEGDILSYTNYINCPTCRTRLMVELTLEVKLSDEENNED